MSKIKGLNWNQIDGRSSKARVRSEIEALMKGEQRSIPANYGFEEGEWNLTDILTAKQSFSVACLQLIYGEDMKGRNIPSMALPVDFKLRVHTRQACHCDKDGKLISEPRTQPGELPVPGDIVRCKNIKRPSEDKAARHTTELRRWAVRGEDSYIYAEFEVDEDLCITVPVHFAHPLLKKFGKRLVYPEFKGVGKNRTVGNNWRFEEVPKDFKLESNSVKKVGRPKKEIQDVKTD